MLDKPLGKARRDVTIDMMEETIESMLIMNVEEAIQRTNGHDHK